jgi:hypothetical protein
VVGRRSGDGRSYGGASRGREQRGGNIGLAAKPQHRGQPRVTEGSGALRVWGGAEGSGGHRGASDAVS